MCRARLRLTHQANPQSSIADPADLPLLWPEAWPLPLGRFELAPFLSAEFVLTFAAVTAILPGLVVPSGTAPPDPKMRKTPNPWPGNGRFGHTFPWSCIPSPFTPQLFV